MQIGPRTQLHVGDDAIDGGAHFAALEVELRKTKVGDGLVIGGLRRALGGGDLVHPLRGDDDAGRQRTVALQVRIGIVEHGALAEQHRLGLLQRDLVARAIDPEQHVAALDLLVVLHQHLGDEARDVGRNRNHVGPDVAIARPRLVHVIIPQPGAGPKRDQNHNTGQCEAT